LPARGKGTPILWVADERDEAKGEVRYCSPLARAGVKLKDGVRVEREDGQVMALARKRRW
jgi:leucyl aminopeptidase (aminopeptidase T)